MLQGSAHILELDETPCQHASSPRHGKVQLQVICGTKARMSMLIAAWKATAA